MSTTEERDPGRPGRPDPVISLGNEFSEIRVSRVDSRNGSRLLIESTRTGQWVALCPLELESLTWQGPQTFSELIGHPMQSLFTEDD